METRDPTSELEGQLTDLLLGDADGLELRRAEQSVHARLFGAATPIRVGRFELRARLGVGGMGVVHAAHDPELDRMVALKLLRVDRVFAIADATGLLRAEARALAKLSHPNVVTVHEVGEFGHALYIAMELVAGPTLQAWLTKPRSIAEIVAMFAAAGAGLSAAHGAGVVHRDFKPENVLVGDDGRPRVVDFGLARVADATVEAPEGPGNRRQSRAAGTAGYVAPEVLAGGAADARSDQYAFCVSLYEALFAALPEDGTASWPVRSVAGESVPRWLACAVSRGLERDPAKRWPDVETLVEQLRRDPSPLRRWMLPAFVIAIAIGAGGVVALRPEPCGDLEASLADTWDDGRRTLVSEAMLASDAPFAAASTTTVLASLDDRAAAWVDAATRICRATHVLHTQSPALLDLRMACLDERRATLDSTARLLAEGGRDVVEQAVEIVSALEPAEACESAAMLDVPSAPEGREDELAAARARLADAHVRFTAARYAETEAITLEVLAQAVDLGRPLEAEASLLLGHAQNELGRVGEAEASFRRAVIAAEAGGHDPLAAECWSRLLLHVGRRRPNDHDELADITAHARAYVERLGGEPVAAVELEAALGWVALYGDRPAEALASFERAIAQGNAAGKDEYWEAGYMQRVAEAHYHLGHWDDAERSARAALAVRERLIGPHHPAVAGTVMLLGSVYERRGDYRSALDFYQRAFEIYERVFPEGHTDAAGALQNIGVVHLALRDLPAAELAFARAVSDFERSVGPDSPELFVLLLNMGIVQQLKGQGSLARSWFERALANARAVAPVSAKVAMALGNLSECWLIEGRADVAHVYATEALRVWRASVPADHPEEAHFLLFFAESALALDRPDIAREPAEQALSLRLRSGGDPGQLARAQFAVARLRHIDGAPDEAIALGLAALTQLVLSPDAKLRDEVTAWLTGSADDHGSRGQMPER